MTVGVAMHVHGQPVHGKGQAPRVGLVPGRTDHLMDGGLRVV